MTLEELKQVDWMQVSNLHFSQREFEEEHIQILLPIEEEGRPEQIQITSIIDAENQSINSSNLLEKCRSAIPNWKDFEDDVSETFSASASLDVTGWHVTDDNGNKWKIDQISYEAKYRSNLNLIPLRFHRYGKEHHNHSFASADFELAGIKGSIVFRRNNDDSTTIFWVPNHVQAI